MKKYRRKETQIEAKQYDPNFGTLLTAYIDVYDVDPFSICKLCKYPLKDHRAVNTFRSPIKVCPFEWIVIENGETSVYSNNEFLTLFEEIL